MGGRDRSAGGHIGWRNFDLRADLRERRDERAREHRNLVATARHTSINNLRLSLTRRHPEQPTHPHGHRLQLLVASVNSKEDTVAVLSADEADRQYARHLQSAH